MLFWVSRLCARRDWEPMIFSDVRFRRAKFRFFGHLARVAAMMFLFLEAANIGVAQGAPVLVGQRVTMYVTSDGWPTPTLQWRKNGAPIAGATGSTFIIESAAVIDAGAYSVVATNEVGSATSPDEVLTVNLGPVDIMPSIQTQPVASQSANVGGTASFAVVASGTPSPSYQWRKNGSNLAGATGSTLALTSLTTGDSGTYTVIVSNIAGNVTSSASVLTVTDPGTGNNPPSAGAPTIQTQPVATQAGTLGGSASFSVVASGTPTILYQWRKNGVNLSGATADTLLLTALTTNDNGIYTVVVSNSQGSVHSSPGVLTVTDPGSGNPPPPPPPPANVIPQFSLHPVISQSVTAGATVLLTAAASGAPDPTFQWQKNGVAIAGATNTSLTLTGVTESDSGTYTIAASNVAGTVVSNGSLLTVSALPVPPPPPPAPPPPPPPPGAANSAPSIMVQPASLQTVVAGNSATLSVMAAGYPAPGFQWRKNSVPIGGATGATLSLPSITAADAAVYSVVVSNPLGTAVSANATLVVHSKPAFVKQPTAQAVAAGSRATLSVAVAAIPGPSYQWRRNGVAIAGATAAVFQIPSLSSAEVGSYSVVATNPIGSTSSFEVPVQIAAPPVITQQPESQTAALQSTVTLSVTASGAPAPAFQWKRNGVVLPGATGSTLTLKGVTPADNGAYSAEASNSLGYAISASAQVTVSETGGINPSTGGGSGDPSSPTVPATVASRIVNLSVRSVAGGDSGSLIVGFVLGGNTGKPILARGVGPTLGIFGVAGALADPTIGIYSGTNLTSSNDDWSANNNAAQIADAAVRLGAFSLPIQSADAALMPTLAAGAYTVQVAGKGSGSGVTLVEVYDAATASGGSLINLSVRAQVGGAESPSLGFVINGTTSKRVLIRAIGPTLGVFGVSDVLTDPRLQLFQGSALIGENDNWGGTASLTTAFASVGAFPLADSTSKDAALVVTLAPGAYTVLVSGVGNTAGATLLEVYDAP